MIENRYTVSKKQGWALTLAQIMTFVILHLFVVRPNKEMKRQATN